MDATQRRKTETQRRDATPRRKEATQRSDATGGQHGRARREGEPGGHDFNRDATREGTTSVVPQSRNASHTVIPNEVRDLLLNFAARRPGLGFSVSTFNCRLSTSASLTGFGTRAKS
jgi:hypothetical protein